MHIIAERRAYWGRPKWGEEGFVPGYGMGYVPRPNWGDDEFVPEQGPLIDKFQVEHYMKQGATRKEAKELCVGEEIHSGSSQSKSKAAAGARKAKVPAKKKKAPASDSDDSDGW